MPVAHQRLRLRARARGFHLVTAEIRQAIAPLLARHPGDALLQLFIEHTSAGLCINENADPDVRHDFALYFDRLAPEHLPSMRHVLEGPDDMPAHIKSVLSGSTLHLPIVGGELHLGTWQGIYLCEFRNRAQGRYVLTSLLY